jgi:hypothetical protein
MPTRVGIYTHGGATHRYTKDEDRCICGACWVWHDDAGTYGCEDAPPPPGLVLDAWGRVVATDEDDEEGR